MASQIKNIIFASALITAIGAVLIILSLIFQLLPMLITDASRLDMLKTANTAFSLLLYPIFFAVYFWAGMRAAKRYGLDPVGGGLVAAISSMMVGIMQLALTTVLGMVVLSRGAPGSSGFGTPEFILASAVFGEMAGMTGIGLSAFCGVGMVIFSAMLNFVVGGTGAIFALRSKNKSGYD